MLYRSEIFLPGILSHLREMRFNKKFWDLEIRLKSDSDTSFKVHKVILAAFAPWYKNSYLDEESCFVEVDADVRAVEAFVDLIYEGLIKVGNENDSLLKDVEILAETLGCSDLKLRPANPEEVEIKEEPIEDDNNTAMETLKSEKEQTKPIKCPRCEMVFIDKNPLLAHAVSAHPEINPDDLLSGELEATTGGGGKAFKCKYCHNESESKQELNHHIRKDHLTCKFCGLDVFSNMQELGLHVNDEHNNSAQPSYEDMDGFDIDKLRRKVKIMKKSISRNKPKKASCPLCPSVRFYPRSLFSSHMTRCHPRWADFAKDLWPYHHKQGPSSCDKDREVYDEEKVFKCTICKDDKKFGHRQSLIYHLNKFHPSVDVNEILSVQSKYKCPECPLEFMTLLRKEDHYIAVHNARGQTEVFSCVQCDGVFPTLLRLKNHEQNVHPKVRRQWVCEICSHICNSSSYLKRHKLVKHSDVREHKCQTCGKEFKVRSELNFHVKSSHTKEKPHVCETCGQGFASNTRLKNHVDVIHMGIKKYKCKDCDRDFSNVGNLKRHKCEARATMSTSITNLTSASQPQQLNAIGPSQNTTTLPVSSSHPAQHHLQHLIQQH